MTVKRLVLFYLFIPAIILLSSFRISSAQEIVLYASQASKVGNWSSVSDSTAAGGARLSNTNAGAGKLSTALSSPSNYAQLTFTASAGKAYRLWIRGKAQSDSPYNDSVFVQFSGSVNSSGSAVYRIGTTSATEVNLEDCMGCGLSGWGWQDNGWGVGVLGPQVFFQTTGTQTLRIQAREDGLSIDQIVLSPANYLSSSPGALKNDHVILAASSGAPAPTPTPTPAPTPSTDDIVIWASNVPSTGIKGNWVKETVSSAAGQTQLHNPDRGAAKKSTALASPVDYFEITFSAKAGQPYRIWLRGRADNNSWANDSVFAQFSGSINILGASAYRIGTTSAVEVNVEDCSGCGLSGWGWQDDGWGLGILGPTIFFQSTGTQTLRIQTREDGVAIDQIVLSSYAFLFTSPGFLKNDSTILQSTLSGSQAPPPPSPTPTPTPNPTPTPTPAPNQAPQVNISATPTSGNSPLFVTFSSSASDPDGFITGYSWTFGNGGTSTVINPTTTYTSAGTYTARLTVTDNDGATSSDTVQISVGTATPPPTSGTLRVLSWNVSFGKGTDSVQNWDRTATWIKNMNPDIAGLCEMPSEFIGTFVNLVSQKTGRTWYWHFVAKYSGTSEGNLILSQYPLSNTGSKFLSVQRSVAKATITVGGKTINFFATHLDPSSGGTRYTQVGELMSYAAGFSESRIVVGDFNAGPDLSETVRMTSTYYDTWMQAMAIGTATAYPDNPVYMHTRTRRGRIDYAWYSKGSANLFLKSTQIPDTRNLSQTNVAIRLGTPDDYGVRPSDHNPMIAYFEIR